MPSVFVVETPLQMVNATEAKHCLGLGDCCLVIMLSEPFPKRAFQPLLSFGGWKSIRYISVSHRYKPLNLKWLGASAADAINEYIKESKQLLKRFAFDRLARRLGKADNLVVGNLFAQYIQHLANRVHAQRIYLLDDGTDTLRVNSLRKNSAHHVVPNRVSFIRWIKDHVRTAFIDWDIRQKESVTFFSSYELDVKPGDDYIRNTYAFWRQRSKEAVRRDAVFFLGQPLVEDGYLSTNAYVNLLTEVIKFYQGKSVVYLTHRRETKAKLEALKAIGLTVDSFDLPIEVHMLTKELPEELASFFSSALDNSRIIFGDRLSVTAFRIGEHLFKPGHEFVAEIYHYLGTQSGPNFRVWDLQPSASDAWD